MTCPAPLEGERYELTYSLDMGASVSILSGHRGALPIDMTRSYAIDLDHSDSNYYHGAEHSLIRRVKTG